MVKWMIKVNLKELLLEEEKLLNKLKDGFLMRSYYFPPPQKYPAYTIIDGQKVYIDSRVNE